ncbi:hypothetical protein Lal_00049849 [Lupinus albus]|nr:hypothetical protein Lal_00049849 [Lupinus albus]
MAFSYLIALPHELRHIEHEKHAKEHRSKLTLRLVRCGWACWEDPGCRIGNGCLLNVSFVLKSRDSGQKDTVIYNAWQCLYNEISSAV